MSDTATANVQKVVVGLSKQVSDLREEVSDNTRSIAALEKDSNPKGVEAQLKALDKRVTELEKKTKK